MEFSKAIASSLLALSLVGQLLPSVAANTAPTPVPNASKPVTAVKAAKPATVSDVSEGVIMPAVKSDKSEPSPSFAVKANTTKQTEVIDYFSRGNAFLRTLALDIGAFSKNTEVAQAAADPVATVAFLDSETTILLHMETLRQAYQQYGKTPELRNALMDTLKKRYTKANNDPTKFFDYGYAELVFESNKNGLFFLRKANDALGSPYTSIAYGIAEIDTDRWIDDAPPDQLTTRKMDVTYKLKDALLFNRASKQPGVWTNYVKIVKALKDYPAFASFTHEDVTLLFVPMGQLLMAKAPVLSPEGYALLGQASNAPAAPQCGFTPSSPLPGDLKRSKGVDFNKDGIPETVNFYSQGANKPYLVQVTNVYNQVIAEFPSWVNYIIEDLDNDGSFELVVRQYDQDPWHPLMVYRWDGHCFNEDTTVSSYFK